MKILVIFISMLFIFTAGAFAYPVYYNLRNHKYHNMDCKWGHKCIRSCIVIDSSEAISRGGIPCKVCGG